MVDKNNNNRQAIENTAISTILSLGLKTDVPYAKEIYKKVENKFGYGRNVGFSYIVESRYKGAEKIIQDENLKQIVELGAGFTPHALNLEKIVENYIEVDFPTNSKFKKKIIKQINPNLNTTYLGMDIFNDETWETIKENLKKGRLGIFGEGFMQYTSPEERKYLASRIKPLLKKYNGIFFYEDSLTFHPEFLKVPGLKKLSEKMSNMSKNKNPLKYISQESMTREWKDLGFKVERVPAYRKIVSDEYDILGLTILKKFKHWKLSIN